MDRNNLNEKICSDCEYSSNQVDFHMDEEKTKYYSKRCIECQTIYRHLLKCREITDVNCIKCTKSSQDVIFDFFKLESNKIFLSKCRNCAELSNDVPEKFCIICEKSSLKIEFDTKQWDGKLYNYAHCKECDKFIQHKKFLEKHSLEEVFCKFCKISSTKKCFGYYKLRDKIALYSYCVDCSDKNDKPELKLCSDCGKSSEEVIFNKNKPGKYPNKCRNCNTIYRRREYNTLDQKLKKHKSGAKRRNYEWKLTDKQANKLFLQNCHYCDKKSVENIDLSGIDRVDNNVGYIVENCVSCCSLCNYMKRDFDVEIFLKQCKNIAKHHRKDKKKKKTKTKKMEVLPEFIDSLIQNLQNVKTLL